MKIDRQSLVRLAMKLQGVPYNWGGSNPLVGGSGLDCSGFCIWVLQVFGVLPAGDWNAYNLSKQFPRTDTPAPGDLAFYGTSDERITHVMMHIGGGLVVGASGGGSTTTTIEEALRIGAKVKIKELNYRTDLRFSVDILQG